MDKKEVLIQVQSDLSRQIDRDVGFRLAYLDSRLNVLIAQPKVQFFQFEQNSFWMSVYSTINWLAHFKFKKDKISDVKMIEWLSEVFDWPKDIATAFWLCGRHPIAHTGARNFFYSEVVEDVNGVNKHMYIDLSLDSPHNWQQSDTQYIALPVSTKGDAFNPKSKLSGQQVIFFYEPLPDLIWNLANDIKKDVLIARYNEMRAYQKVYRGMPFLQDDGEMNRINNYLDIYPRSK